MLQNTRLQTLPDMYLLDNFGSQSRKVTFCIDKLEKCQHFYTQVDMDDKKLKLTALSAIGVRLFYLEYDNEVVTTTNWVPLPQSFDGTYIIRDILLGNLSEENLAKYYQVIKEEQTLQLIGNGNEVIYTIAKESVGNGMLLEIRNFVDNYMLTIEEIEK